MPRLKSCQYCGRIHSTAFDCGRKPKRKYQYKRPDADSFRNTNQWKRKRDVIKERDHYLCQVCIRGLYNTIKIFNSESLEVHHCDKLRDNFEKRMDDDNLLTVGEYHHKKCASGEIPKEVVKKIILEQMSGIPPGGGILGGPVSGT